MIISEPVCLTIDLSALPAWARQVAAAGVDLGPFPEATCRCCGGSRSYALTVQFGPERQYTIHRSGGY